MGVARFLALAVLITRAMGQVSETDTCASHTEACSDCIKDPSVCVWCAMNKFSGARCKSARAVTDDWCPGSIQNPNNTMFLNDINNLNFSSNIGKVIQMRPQRIQVKLRPGMPMEFNFSYKPASDYPVDLYFLLDASLSMEKIKNKIEEQSTNIYNTMVKLTSNIQLGMGSFVDKNAIPFTEKIDSEKTYSFRNRLKLTNNPEKFKETVGKTTFGNNYDPPEGGLDALSQVITCKEQIGWRNESRKLIVLFTDGPYHQAGDGIAAGIFKPYDGKCHMYDQDVYTKELEMDYPSVSIIQKLAADEEITIIFVVNSNVEFTYSHLSEAISGSKYITYNEGSKISSLLTNIYEDITRTIKLKVNMKSEHRNNFLISFHPNCTETKNNNLNCNVKKGEEIKFTGKITLLKNITDETATVDIVVEGIKEKVTLDINLIQDCECPNDIPKAPDCSNAGTLKCGICECDENRYGDKCACIANGLSSGNANDNSTCIAKGDILACSGHGSCICGSCICRSDSRFVGKYCQYNEDNCPRHNNDICNGHGKCVEEKCVCSDEWTGEACQCPVFNRRCIGPGGEMCNGRGECQCGECVCNRTADWDARENQDPYCNILPCPDCYKPQCNLLIPCAKCAFAGETCSMCDDIKITRVELLNSSIDSSWNVCPDLRVEVGCYTRYMYKYIESEYGIELVVQTDKNCLESYYMYGGICLGSLILIGIATLVGWKWLTDAQDRREYERFLKEHAEDLSEPCVNACYRPASSTFQNPAFRKPSVDYK
ncbi:hypothetical protein ABMA28_013333 [Loxostege sticticalis]|uniref:Integrin beta n=1 Tax=Loxostege sticticalis TaxID=481309 RepID=A0ABD0THY0_LOXSC